MSPLVLLKIPALLSDKTDTVEGTIETKQVLSAVFTVFFQSGLFEALTPQDRDNVIRLQGEFNELVDLIFVEKVSHKARKANYLKRIQSRRRSKKQQ